MNKRSEQPTTTRLPLTVNCALQEAKTLLRKTMPVARRFLGENDVLTLRMRWNYARALYQDDGATLDDLREAVTTLEDTARTHRAGACSVARTRPRCLASRRFVQPAKRASRAPRPRSGGGVDMKFGHGENALCANGARDRAKAEVAPFDSDSAINIS